MMKKTLPVPNTEMVGSKALVTICIQFFFPECIYVTSFFFATDPINLLKHGASVKGTKLNHSGPEN